MLGCTAVLQAQDGGTVSTTVDKNKILIGEQLKLTIAASYKTGKPVTFPALDSVANFELLDKPQVDSSEEAGITSVKIVYTLTSFDSGQWVIPAYNLATGMQTTAIPVEVVFSDFNPSQPYHGITDVEDVPAEEKKESWWWYAAGAALLALIMYLLIRRKKKMPLTMAPVPVPVDAYKEAMRGLDALQEKQSSPKEYYSELSDIFRLYIYRRKGILSLQKTTDDLVVQLASLNLEKEQYEKLSQSLRMSDFVKFAKYVPGAADNRTCLEEIKRSVTVIEQTEKERTIKQ